MNRRNFLKSLFIFTSALWIPKTGILRSVEASGSYFYGGQQNVAPPSPWIPTDIGGCTFFLRSDLVTKDGVDRVNPWPDQEDAHDANQTTDAKKFVWTANVFGTNPGLHRDDVDDEMRIAAFTLNQPFTLLVVVKPEALATRLIISGANTILIDTWGNVLRMSAGSVLTGSIGLFINTVYVFEMYFNGPNSVEYVNNVQDITGDAGANNITEYIDLGVTGDPYFQIPLLGYFGEIFGMSGALAGADRTNYYSYLAARYNY